MSQLRASRPGLGVCVVICIFLFLYLRNPVPEDPEEGPTSAGGLECGFYPDELCSALFEGKPAAPQLAKFCKISHQSQILAHLHTSGNCSGISQGLRFITKPLSAEEGNFPLAYIITVPKEPASFVQLLRAVYAPQNAYCIHADREASEQARAAAQTLAGCFENIFISSEREKATSAAVTRLEADINCMEDLAHPKFQWNYVIKLCGQDFPIKTNREVIHYLRSRARDKNITPVKAPKATSTTRPRHPDSSAEEPTHVSPNRRAHAEPPHNITVYSGSAYFALTRKFVEFVLTDIRAKDLLQWSKAVERPEQHYWATLNRLPGKDRATQPGTRDRSKRHAVSFVSLLFCWFAAVLSIFCILAV